MDCVGCGESNNEPAEMNIMQMRHTSQNMRGTIWYNKYGAPHIKHDITRWKTHSTYIGPSVKSVRKKIGLIEINDGRMVRYQNEQENLDEHGRFGG